jgi:hypothetical protein
LDGLPQLFEVIVNRRDDNRDILGRIIWLRRDWEGFVAPMAEKVDDGAEVTVEPANSMSAPTLRDCPMLLIGCLGTIWGQSRI